MRGIPTGKPEGPLFHTGRGIVPGTGCATTYLEQRTFLCGIRADGRSSMRDKGFPERETACRTSLSFTNAVGGRERPVLTLS